MAVRLRSKPQHVKVFWRGEQRIINCNPIQVDLLDWKVEEKSSRHGKHVDLVISWECQFEREIEWEVSY